MSAASLIGDSRACRHRKGALLTCSLRCLAGSRSGWVRSAGALGVPVAILLVGTLVYLVDRPVGSVAFFAESSFANRFPIDFGVLSLSLPSFAHTFTFSAFTAGLMGGRRNSAAVACLTWFVVECLFEIGQSAIVVSRLASVIPARFESLPILSQTRDYFVNGICDPGDLLAIALGAISAYFFVVWIGRRPALPEKIQGPKESRKS